MPERDLVGTSEFGSEETLGTQFRVPDFPSSFSEFMKGRREAGLVDTAFDIAQAAMDGAEAYWARKRLVWEQAKPNFYEEEDIRVASDDAPVVLFGGGFMTWKGLPELRKFSLGRELLASGPYSVLEESFKRSGAHYIEVWPKKGSNTGDAEEDLEALAEAVKIADATSDGPKIFLGHSFFGHVSYLFAARYPDLADKIGAFLNGGSPLPDHLNSVVEAAMVFLSPNTKVGRKQLEEGIEYLNSPQSRNRNFVSIIGKYDHIITGPAPGKVVVTPTGHSAIFFNQSNLDGAMELATTGQLPMSWQEVKPLSLVA